MGTELAAPGFRNKMGEVVDQRRGVDFQVLKTRDLVNRLNVAGDALRVDSESVPRLRGRLRLLLRPAHPRVPWPARPRGI